MDAAGKVPADPKAQVEAAFDQMKRTLTAAGLDYKHVAFVNPYQTEKVTGVMNEIYASHFEFGNTPARATIRANSLPLGANIEFTGVAVRDISKRRAVRLARTCRQVPRPVHASGQTTRFTVLRNRPLFPVLRKASTPRLWRSSCE